MHTGYDPEQIYRDWQASGLSFEDFMIGLKQKGDPWQVNNPPLNDSQAFYDEQTANFRIFGQPADDMPPREDWMRRRGMPVQDAPRIVSKEARIAEIEHELDIIRGRIPTPKGYRINPLRIKELMQELKQLQNTKI